MSLPLQIRALRALRARLEQIATEDGYLTDSGERVLMGPRFIEADQCPAILVIDGGDLAEEPTGSGNSRSMKITQTVYLDCYARIEADSESESASAVRADAKQAALDYTAQALRDDDGVITGPVIYVGAEPIEQPEAADVEGFRLTLNWTLLEAYGDPSTTR